MNDFPATDGGRGGLFAISQRRAPTNLQAEHALLGAILANGKALHGVVEFLRPEHFAEPAHGRIYKEATRRILAGGVADPIALRTWWEGDPDAATLGGFDFLAQLLGAMVGIINAGEYGRAIHDAWQRRELIDLGEELVNRSFATASGDPPARLVTTMIDRLDAVVAGAGTDRKAIPSNDAMDLAIGAMERAMQGGVMAGVSTGMRTVDDALGGFEPQNLIVLGGRPGMGKSALGMQFGTAVAITARSAHAAGESKRGVLFISLEMSAEQLGRRMLAGLAQVPLEAIKRGRLAQSDVERIILARRDLQDLPLSIEDCSNLSMGAIRLKARMARRRHGLGLIVVDHLHIVRPEDADVKNGATAAIGRISNGLKQLAKEFEVPVLALAQLNRGLESREDKRPTLADLRQAGEIEQDADVVAFVYRGEYYLPTGNLEQNPGETRERFDSRLRLNEDARQAMKGKAELILAKVRDGSPQTIPLLFDGRTTSFREPA